MICVFKNAVIGIKDDWCAQVKKRAFALRVRLIDNFIGLYVCVKSLPPEKIRVFDRGMREERRAAEERADQSDLADRLQKIQ